MFNVLKTDKEMCEMAHNTYTIHIYVVSIIPSNTRVLSYLRLFVT